MLGVSEANVYPSVAISYGRKNYAMDKTDAEALSADTTKAFIEKFLSGELSKRVRSQPLPDPAENAKKLVKDVVALNFQAVALDPRKDVLVKFYASWCGHCKETAPAYERAASLLSSVNSVVFAQIEASENDVPEALRIAGYPTFILFPATPESTPVYFNAPEVTAEDIAMFVHDNAAVKFDVPAELAEAVAAKEKEREKTESEAKADAVKEGEEEEEEENVIVVEEERKEEL